MRSLLFIVFGILAISGCENSTSTLGHKKFYNQVSPAKYPKTTQLMIFEYQNVDIDEIYEMLFSEFLIIGRSGFNGKYENPMRAKSYAESIGTDIFITTSQIKEARTSFVNLNTPTSSTTHLSGYKGGDYFYGKATTTTVPVRANRYNQYGMYLKNVNGFTPLWERTRKHYDETGKSKFSGVWKNENYEIELYQSGEHIVAFIANVMSDRKMWRKNQLKMIFGEDSGSGIYLMGKKTPIPAVFSVNRFGHLEVNLLTSSETFSFARLP